MRIKNLIKHSLISIFTLSFILINNINIVFACGSPAMAGVYAALEKISGEMGMPPLHFVCLLYGGCYNDMNAIEKYTNDIAKNLNNLRGKIGDVEFNKFWNPSAPSEEAIGEKLQEFLGLTRATPESEVVHEKSTGGVLDMYKKMLGSAGIPLEDEAGYNKLREELEKVKGRLAEKVMPLLFQAQGEVFAKLDELDKEIEVSKEAINEFHKAEIEEHKKASEIQALCKSRIGLVKENLFDLLGDVEQGLTTLASIAPDNIEHSIEHIICFSKVRQAVMNMSYITMPDYLSRSLDRRVRLREEIKLKEGPVADIIKFQRGIGDLQTRISFLREPIIQLTIKPTIVSKEELPQEEECTSGKGGDKAKKSKAVIIDPYIPWQNPELATGIAEKLNTYSLNQYHFLRKDASAGMDKAHEIWTSLGYINEDSGFFEARIRQAIAKSQICSVTGRQNIKKDIKTQKDKYYGDTYTVVIEVPGIALEKQTVLTSWEYKKIEVETADNEIVLLSYPRCVTIYQKEEKKK
ncbi:MAG: hypothetical protein IJC97_01255 [Oscillospiraceae bacterium]|nr:hypothetical protein [Oscillospiraceae bacterium]